MPFDLDETHDPQRKSWVASANAPGADFPIQNLPFGVFRPPGSPVARCGVAIGDFVLDVGACAGGLDGTARDAAQACRAPALNDLMELGRQARNALRRALSERLLARDAAGQDLLSPHLSAISSVQLLAPVRIGGFTDFFASIEHATNAGSLFRPDEPLFPNYKHVPIGYNGRASSIVPTGTGIVRPKGQTLCPGEPTPTYRPSQQLDHEMELGVYLGRNSQLGATIPIEEAWDFIFGVSLLNDWSARDIQAWEYRPLGPFLGKSFATTVSPWVVTAEALAPFRVPARPRPDGDPMPLPHFSCAQDAASGAVDIKIECRMRSARMRERGLPPLLLGASSSRDLYWTFAQMVTHHASNGCNMQVGDLIGTGTISGRTSGSLGSLLEITRRGAEPLLLPTGETRAFIEDGDEISLSGRCEREGFASLGFGASTGRVLPAFAS